jgi:hypothetical protein
LSKPQLRNAHSKKRERAVSLTGLYSETYLPSGVTVDWVAVCNDLEFDDEEAAYFLAKKVNGVPRVDISSLFGWHPAQAARIRWRVDRKIAKARNSGRSSSRFVTQSGLSSNPIILETLPSGRGVWTIPHISHLEEEISRIRVKNISSSQCLRFTEGDLAPSISSSIANLLGDPGTSRELGAGCGSELQPTNANRQGENESYMEPTLEVRLRHERAKMDKLIVSGQSTEADVERAAQQRAQLQRGILKAQEDELLLDGAKPPSADMQKKLQASEMLYNDAVTRRDAYRRAANIQRAAIMALEDEITANKFQQTLVDIAPDAEELRRAIEVVMQKANAVDNKLRRAGMHDRACDLVPVLAAKWENGYEVRSKERAHRITVFNHALWAIQDRMSYTDYEQVAV